MKIIEKRENLTKMLAKIAKIQKEHFKTLSKSLKIMKIVEKMLKYHKNARQNRKDIEGTLQTLVRK